MFHWKLLWLFCFWIQIKMILPHRLLVEFMDQRFRAMFKVLFRNFQYFEKVGTCTFTFYTQNAKQPWIHTENKILSSLDLACVHSKCALHSLRKFFFSIVFCSVKTKMIWLLMYNIKCRQNQIMQNMAVTVPYASKKEIWGQNHRGCGSDWLCSSHQSPGTKCHFLP